MSKRNNRVVAYLTDDELKALKEWSDETDKSRSHLVREAILEYLDHDRTDRIEEVVRENNQLLSELADTLAEPSTHTHTDEPACTSAPSGSNSTEKMRSMVDRVQTNHAPVVNADDLDRIIEDEAGADDRTLRKYKGLMRKRGLLFEHPGDPPLWTTETDQWLDWLGDYGRLNGRTRLEDVVDEYPASVRDKVGDDGFYIELAEVVHHDG